MIEPTITQRTEQPCVFIPISVSLREWGNANALVGELFAWLHDHGVALTGPPFFRYRTIGDMDRPFNLEVGVPVGEHISGDGKVRAGVIPGGTYATAIHSGHPDRLRESLTALDHWLADQHLAPAIATHEGNEVWDGRYEFYLTDPADQPDRNQWSIEIAYLLNGEDTLQPKPTDDERVLAG